MLVSNNMLKMSTSFWLVALCTAPLELVMQVSVFRILAVTDLLARREAMHVTEMKIHYELLFT